MAGISPPMGMLLVSLLTGAVHLVISHKFAEQNKCNHVFLTVSSLWHQSGNSRGIVDRELELNWEPTCEPASLPDWVGLYDADPHTNSQKLPTPLVRVRPVDHPAGYYRTDISLGRPKYAGGWNKNSQVPPTEGDHCFPFWIAAHRNNTLLQADCLKIRPTWMGDNRLQLGNSQLGSLFLPGTHNSGSHHRGSSLTRRDAFSRYLLTQDTDVWGQLVHGIRYLDLRVGYYPSLNKTRKQNHRFWINHDIIRVGPLLPVLQDVKQFLMSTKREVVVLDFHRFPVGFHNRQGRHRRLVSLLNKELGSFVLPPPPVGAAIKLDQIWSKDRRLIITYGEKETVKEFKWLWNPLTQEWGNKQTTADLQSFLQCTMDKAKQQTGNPTLWAAMAELTPTPLDVMFKPTGSLRQMADAVNRNITSWFRNLWWKEASVVATDFFLGNGIVDVSVDANLRRINIIES